MVILAPHYAMPETPLIDNLPRGIAAIRQVMLAWHARFVHSKTTRNRVGFKPPEVEPTFILEENREAGLTPARGILNKVCLPGPICTLD